MAQNGSDPGGSRRDYGAAGFGRMAERVRTVWRRVKDQWRRLMARPQGRRIALAAAGLLAVVVGVGGALLLRPQAETVDGFIARWNAAVEANDDGQYDALVSEALIETKPGAWLRGFDSIQELHRKRKRLQPSEGGGDPDYILVPATQEVDEDAGRATLAFSSAAERLSLTLDRSGWQRRWRIGDVAQVADSPEPAHPLVLRPADAPGVDAGPESAPEITLAAATDAATPLDTELKLRQVLDAWRTAWEQKEIDAYIAWYADYATIRRITVVDGHEISETLDVPALRARMQRLSNRYDRIEVGIANLEVRGTHAEAELQFRQEYTAYADGLPGAEPVYHDIGTKWLKFVNEEGEWRIYEEDWRNYVNVPSFPLN